MKILHLFANWKWTGPADPALSLAAWQAESHEVLFLSGTGPDGQESRIQPFVDQRGVRSLPGLNLSKHARWRANRVDVRRLCRVLRDWRPDVVHTHLDNDHRVASLALRRAPGALLVRSVYDPTGLSGGFRTKRLARRALDGLIACTQAARQATLDAYGGSTHSLSVSGQARPLRLIECGVDRERFDAARYDREAARRRLELQPDEVGVGIVARVQPHRRFEILLEAAEAVARKLPQFRLLVIGRGTHIERVLHEPVRARGLQNVVRSVGYLAGDEYPAVLPGLDASVFLVPGSDGTCRALREQMALGLAPLVTTRTPLPEIVDEGNAGLVCEESAEGLVDGLLRLVSDTGLRERLGRGAATAAAKRFDGATQTAKVLEFYDELLSERARAGN
ncbi:MAG: hypothetical protein DHS20C15_11670 [Planctomycetota bacterium]|nr:MAG: hypothetical protein DHS20C15_11670 [Planctomycetota bacterium]